MDFPHLKDTEFPLIDNVNVYKYQNNFDYARWRGKVSFKLMNVLWNSDYTDVPYFDTEKKRDEWFNSQDGYVGVLESLFNNTPENSVKIPIPYNDAYRYNYLVVDMPMQTSSDNPINYEDKSIRVKRWFYFIEDITQAAPSTTELILSVDYWMTFIYTVQIPYLMLERGHAPMTKTTVEQFLSNPIMNNEYLLADDFNYGNETIIQTSSYKPIGNGKKYVLFCAPYRYQDFELFNSNSWEGNSTPPSYANQDNRWGYQLTVNDYEWKYGNANYNNADLPINNMVQTGILNGCECFAIEGSEARSFFNDCAKNCVQFIHGIKAMFILDENLFTKSIEFNFRNKTLYVVDRKINTDNFTFTKSAFGFDSKYANITKLYTSPYSTLEITDDEGSVFSAKIENCGNIQMHEEVALVYPFLNYNVFFSGINGDGSMNYVWKSVQDTDNNKTMWASDFSKFMMNWNVPTYEIYVSAENEYAANHAADMFAKRAGAIKDYQNAVRYANTTRENVVDSMQTNTDNVAASGATNTANVERSTTKDVANTAASGQTNTDNVAASGATNTANVVRSTTKDVTNTAATQAGLIDNKDDTNDNADLKIDTYLDGGTISQIGGSGGYLSETYAANLNKLSNDTDADQILMYQTAGIEQDTIAATATVNAAGAIGGGVVSGAEMGSIGGVPGAVAGGLANGIAQGVSVGMSAMIAVTKNQNMVDNTISASNAKFRSARDCIMALTNAQKTYNGNCKDADNNLRDSIVNRFSGQNGINNANEGRNKTAADANAADVQTTNNANAVRTQNTNNANEVRNKTSADANAAAVQTTNNANAVRTQNTEVNNATYTRSANIEAEKANLVQKQLEAANSYKNAKLQAPHEQGSYSGDFAQDVYQRRGVRINIRTQTKAAIAQAGDAMLRFGYALHRVWDMSNGFHYGKEFTFWKAEDIWINDGSGTANAATNAIGNILIKGVTIWRNPENIGMVGIYDNL